MNCAGLCLSTLAAEMFCGSYFWLETRVILKISTHSVLNIQEHLTDFHGNEANKIQMADSKKLSFSKSQILNIFCENFMD